MNTERHTGETDLTALLRSMQPMLHEGEFVFCTVSSDADTDRLSPLMLFREQEGTTLVLRRKVAEREINLRYSFPCRMITLHVHSSLEAVGFMACITRRLATLNIGVNPVSAFFHDHLFVPIDRAEVVLAELQRMASENGCPVAEHCGPEA